ncbi:hypothetical protein BOTBODRAFT_29296 [Botryobasidium botryosum FD-172 SS1]|uniref:PABS domain-containing protein n=1 Tax=Botryobasidium botryosum (strain FD-172 SS1) TaxID=930990 RepID=A0A067N1F7_BOTB1|nr:hypothetical protein BOTBODRAFT_29296 [Botryobasidium botryosum FD-172 SS1]
MSSEGSQSDGKRAPVKDTPRKVAPPNQSAYSINPIIQLVKILALLAAFFVSNIASQLALHPLYGSIPTSLHFHDVTLFATLLSTFTPLISQNTSQTNVLIAIGTVLSIAPVSILWSGSALGRLGDPVWGPVITHLTSAAPVLFLGVPLIEKWLGVAKPGELHLVHGAGHRLVVWYVLKAYEGPVRRKLASVGADSTMLLLGTGLLFTFGGVISAFTAEPAQEKDKKAAPKRGFGVISIFKFMLPISAIAFSLTHRPYAHPPYPYTTGDGSVKILARSQSVTGMIVVAESMKDSYRYLRCDHSILGGRWIIRAPFGDKLSDSMYAAFILQEAVRLVEREETSEQTKKALVIGLGTGIAAGAFTQHSIETTVVEIDPVVYKYAQTFFDFPKPHAIFLEDAHSWVNNRTGSLPEAERFDYVVHDCFSGGGAPTQMFTTEFWTNLKGLVKSDGVVAVNFAGVVNSDASRAILSTLLHNFKQCRVFHDQDSENDKTVKGTDFVDLIFFCTPSSRALKFRASEAPDYLASFTRQYLLSSFPQREVDIRLIQGEEYKAKKDEDWILYDAQNPLGEWQRASGVKYWEFMRKVLPDSAWEAY